jgi:hypothetical protein
MGGTLAKLDSNDKIIEIIPKARKISQDKLDKVKEMYNNYGIIKIRVDAEKMDKFVLDYVSKLLKGNKKLEEVLKQGLQGVISLYSMLLSMNGFILISEVDKIEKFIEGYDNIEHFTQIDNDRTDSDDIFVRKNKPEYPESESKDIDEQITEAASRRRLRQLMIEIEKDNQTKTQDQGVLFQPKENNIQYVDEENSTQYVGKENNIQYVGKENSTPVKNDVMKKKGPDFKSMELIVPKIYLTSDRLKFMELIFTTFDESMEKLDPKKMFIIKQLDTILESLSKGSNPEIKIANIVGLMIRAALIVAVVQNFSKLGDNVISQDEQMQYMAIVISELLAEFPSDTCTFYNDKLDFIKFTPNVCDVKRTDKSEHKCPQCPECSKVECPDIKCPPVIIPEIKTQEVKCPPVVIPEIKTQEVKCPPVVIPEMKCPNINLEPSSTWKYLSIVLVLVLIGFVIFMSFSNKNSNNSRLGNLAKLSK